jgi:N-acetylneuraminate lyase
MLLKFIYIKRRTFIMSKKADILVPLFTTFNKDGSIDYDTFAKIERYVLDKGADGVYVGGSSAECFSLTQEERKKVLELAVKVADGKQVVAHVGAIGTGIACDLAAHAKKAGADAIASVPPFYHGFQPGEIKGYYTAIADASDLPVIIYNVPGTTGVGLSLAQFKDILSDDRVVAVKYTDVNYYTLDRIKKHTGAFIYSGADECFAYALMAGADGGIGTSMNYCTEKFIAIKEAFDKGDIATAQSEQSKINNCVQAIIETRGLPAMKYMTTVATGIDVGCCRKPFRELTQDEKKLLEKTAEENL